MKNVWIFVTSQPTSLWASLLGQTITVDLAFGPVNLCVRQAVPVCVSKRRPYNRKVEPVDVTLRKPYPLKWAAKVV